MARAINDDEYREEYGHSEVLDTLMNEHQRVGSSYQSKME
jgi:hypothetical protein